MSDHLIAEANRHAMALPKTNPTHADIAWYVREVGELRAEVERLRDGGVQRIKDAMAVVMDERDSFKARASRAETELATERARLDWLEDHGWITGEPCDRAAIDAAMKEDAK